MKTLTTEIRSYLETALWSSSDSDGEPLDRDFCIDDLAPDVIEQAEADLQLFQTRAGKLLNGLSPTDVAHAFWLTRNRHGAGFWDGDYPKPIGEALTEIAHTFSEVDLYVGDDGKIYS